MIKHIQDDGTLLFDSIGISAASQPCCEVFVGKNKIPGVIGLKPVHLLSKEDRKKQVEESDLCIDIGARSRRQAQELISEGDHVLFDSEFRFLSNARIKAKALDDRIGCAILCDLITRPLKYDLFFAFTVGEELGTRGAFAAAKEIAPDIAVIAEATTASDIPDCEGADKVCCLGGGAVIPFMDGGTAYDRELRKFACALAEKNSIKIQTKSKIAGGTDARTFQRSAGACRVIGAALPCRYIHTSSCVADLHDVFSLRNLLFALADNIEEFPSNSRPRSQSIVENNKF